MDRRLVTAAALAFGAVCALAGCRTSDRGEPAPFAATPPPDVYVAPPEAEAAAAVAGPAAGADCGDHIYGCDVYPCEGHAVCAEASPADGMVQVSLGGAEFIDPSLAHESAGTFVVQEIFEGLLSFPPGNGPPIPGVAETWELGDDMRTWTFHLRKNARWSNGRTVTAHDFVYAWTRKLLPETASQAAEHHFFIKNAKAFNEGKIKDAEQLGMRAVDDFTLSVELEEPTPFWLEYVQSAHYVPVPREAVEQWGNDWTRPEHIVTNGPFHMTEWRPRDRMVLKKSETYWDKDSIRVAGTVIWHSESETDDLRRYEAGQTHILQSSIPAEKISVFMEDKRPDLFIDPYLAYYYYAFRVDRPPFDNLKVRQAVDMAIDKERLVKHVTRGMQVPADGPVPPFFERTMGYPKPEGRRFDPQRARELLAEAGFPNGVDLPKITLIYNTYEIHRLIAEFVQRSLKENLGIEVAIENMEWKSLLKQLRSGDFQIARFGWIGGKDPYTFLNSFRHDSPNNEMGYKNPEVDRLLDESLRERDEPKRLALMAKAEALVQADTPITPIYYYTRVYLKKPVLRGVEQELTSVHLMRHMYWGDKAEVRP
jgi:oligopeptide transport system substrate-binding protein